MKISKEIQPGDYVEVHLGKVIYEGILLEVPEDEKGTVLLKLDSGYNIGFNKKDIFEVKLVEKSKDKQEKMFLKMKAEKPNIAMILTGGTIAARYNSKKGGVTPLTSPVDFFKFYPDIFKLVNVTHVEVPFMKDAGEMDPKDWEKIAKIADKFLKDPNIKGIIVTHGTDSLHYTSAALSFFLKDLNKPVVLTYAQKSSDRASSDANLNLKCAALASISDIAEVVLVGHASSNDDFCYVMPGTKVRKLHSSKRDAFKTVNAKPIAKIYPDKIEFISNYKLRNKNKFKSDIKFEEKVALIKFYPGMDAGILDYYMKNKYKGIVIEVLGLGQIAGKASRHNWLTKLKEVQRKGMVVCAAAQTIYGRVDPLVYSTGRDILNTGVIYLEDMLSETALIKLGWVLGHKDWAKNREMVKEKMLHNFAGELNGRLEE